jgi:hypothetical protein
MARSPYLRNRDRQSFWYQKPRISHIDVGVGERPAKLSRKGTDSDPYRRAFRGRCFVIG